MEVGPSSTCTNPRKRPSSSNTSQASGCPHRVNASHPCAVVVVDEDGTVQWLHISRIGRAIRRHPVQRRRHVLEEGERRVTLGGSDANGRAIELDGDRRIRSEVDAVKSVGRAFTHHDPGSNSGGPCGLGRKRIHERGYANSAASERYSVFCNGHWKGERISRLELIVESKYCLLTGRIESDIDETTAVFECASPRKGRETQHPSWFSHHRAGSGVKATVSGVTPVHHPNGTRRVDSKPAWVSQLAWALSFSTERTEMGAIFGEDPHLSCLAIEDEDLTVLAESQTCDLSEKLWSVGVERTKTQSFFEDEGDGRRLFVADDDAPGLEGVDGSDPRIVPRGGGLIACRGEHRSDAQR